MNNPKTTLSGIASALLSFLAFATAIPSDLQALIVRQLPAGWSNDVALGLALAAFFLRWYKAQNTPDADRVTPRQ